MATSHRGNTPTLTSAIYGAIVGILVFISGYLLTFLTAVSTFEPVSRGTRILFDAGAAFAPDWKVAGWLFYDAHFVGTWLGQGRGLVDTVALASVQYLYVVVPLLLLIAGGVVAVLTRAADPHEGVAAGSLVAVGYFLSATVFATLIGYAYVAPSLLRAIVIAGLVYPIAFGAIGGGVAGILRRDRTDHPDSPEAELPG